MNSMNDRKREMRVGVSSRRGRPPDHAGIGFAGALLVLMITAVLAMSAGTDARAAVRSLLEARQERVVIQKWDLSCGAAALATVLKYQYGEPVTEREVALALMQRKEYLADPSLVRARQGFSLLDLQRAVDRFHQYKGIGLGRLSFKDLIERAPVIVPVDFHGYNHFVVFRGVYRGRVLLADPAWGNRIMPVAAFAQVWREYPEIGRIGFLVAPRDGKARPNRLAPRPEDFVTAPEDFDDDDGSVDFRRTSRGPVLLTGPALDAPVGYSNPGQVLVTGPALGNQTLPVATSTEGWSLDVTSIAEPSPSVTTTSTPTLMAPLSAVSVGGATPSSTSATILPATVTPSTSGTTSLSTTSLSIPSTTTNQLAPLPQGLH